MIKSAQPQAYGLMIISNLNGEYYLKVGFHFMLYRQRLDNTGRENALN